MMLDESVRVRFWSHVAVGSLFQCWEWTAFRNEKGYGKLMVWRKCYRAHRLSFALCRDEPINDGDQVLHTCDNPPCVNPLHLFLGDNSTNRTDMLLKGRHWRNTKRDEVGAKIGASLLVSMNLKRKATLRDFKAISEWTGTGQEIAAQLGLSPMTVSLIRRGIRVPTVATPP